MKKLLLTAVCILFTILSFGQTNKITLTGIIEVTTGEVFPYKVVFTESAGVIKGYSFTYKEPDDTKAAITGTFDKYNRTLSFRETEIIYSHSVHTRAYMCLLFAQAEYVQGGNGKMLKGTITSAETDKTACTGGTVTFNNPDELQNLFDPHEKFDTVISMKKKVKEALVDKEANEPVTENTIKTEKITKGIEKTFEWHTDTVIIDIWDGGTVDGDMITLEYNGMPYLTHYSLTKQKKHLRIPRAQGADTITILAENEGSDPPNTASLMLIDGTTRYSVLAYNSKGQVAVIKIKRANSK